MQARVGVEHVGNIPSHTFPDTLTTNQDKCVNKHFCLRVRPKLEKLLLKEHSRPILSKDETYLNYLYLLEQCWASKILE